MPLCATVSNTYSPTNKQAQYSTQLNSTQLNSTQLNSCACTQARHPYRHEHSGTNNDTDTFVQGAANQTHLHTCTSVKPTTSHCYQGFSVPYIVLPLLRERYENRNAPGTFIRVYSEYSHFPCHCFFFTLRFTHPFPHLSSCYPSTLMYHVALPVLDHCTHTQMIETATNRSA